MKYHSLFLAFDREEVGQRIKLMAKGKAFSNFSPADNGTNKKWKRWLASALVDRGTWNREHKKDATVHYNSGRLRSMMDGNPNLKPKES